MKANFKINNDDDEIKIKELKDKLVNWINRT
jgi:hypothetical protein